MKDSEAGPVREREPAGIWWQAARCVGRPELFFPPAGPEPEEARGDRERAAIRLCMRCSIRARCLDYALHRDIRSGIWGGRTERDRAEAAAGGVSPADRAGGRL